MYAELSELICNHIFVRRTDNQTCLVGEGCIKWKRHYRCFNDSSGVGINTTLLAPGPPDPLQEADVSKPSIRDEKKKKTRMGSWMKEMMTRPQRWLSGWKFRKREMAKGEVEPPPEESTRRRERGEGWVQQDPEPGSGLFCFCCGVQMLQADCFLLSLLCVSDVYFQLR